jgi:hypothetical protein
MPLTPRSRVYEEKLANTRKKYESRNAFASERARKATESFSTPAPKKSFEGYTRLNTSSNSKTIDENWGLFKQAITNPIDTLKGAGKVALTVSNPSMASAAFGPKEMFKTLLGMPSDKGSQQAMMLGSIISGPEGKAANMASKEATPLFKGFESAFNNNAYVFDKGRISEAAQASTELANKIAKQSILRANIEGLPAPQYAYTAEDMAKRGVKDLRDLVYLQQYGAFDDLIKPDPIVQNLYRFLKPETLSATFLSPAANVATTGKTLFDPSRFKFLTEATGNESLFGNSIGLDLVRETVKNSGGLISKPNFKHNIPEDFKLFNRLSSALNPDLKLPRGISGKGTGHGLEGEHSAIPVGNLELGLESLANKGKTEFFDEIPALAHSIRTRGLDLPKILNRGFASDPRVLGETISRDAPAFKSIRKNAPILFNRFEEAGGLKNYGEDLISHAEAAPNLIVQLLEELNSPNVVKGLRERSKSRGNFRFGVKSNI